MKTKTAADADAITVGDLVEFQDAAPGAQDAPGEALTFMVRGTPVAQPRMRWVAGKPVSTARANAKRWKTSINNAAQAATLAPGVKEWLRTGTAWEIDLVFSFSTDKADLLGNPHTYKPDKDNLEKLVLDAIVKAHLIKDDALVYCGTTTKLWAQQSSLIVTIRKPRAPLMPMAESAPAWLKATIERPTD